MVEVLLRHPLSHSLSRCRIRVERDGLWLCRVSGPAEATGDADTPAAESEPIGIRWHSLRGFSADESFETAGGRRLQVLEIDTDHGVLTVLASAPEVSVLLGLIGRWAGTWRRARSPIGVVLGGRRRRLLRRVA